MRIIGFQRLLAILVLSGVCASLYVYNNLYLVPKSKQAQQQLNQNRAQIDEATVNLDQIRRGLEKFSSQKEMFEKVEQYDFFAPQDRLLARRKLNAMQKESRLLAAKYVVQAATTEVNEKAAEAGYKILNTEIVFTLEALEDSDIFEYIYMLDYGFPGHISIQNFKMERTKEITQPLLRQMGTDGKRKPVATATMSVNWRTMVPDETIAITNENDGGG